LYYVGISRSGVLGTSIKAGFILLELEPSYNQQGAASCRESMILEAAEPTYKPSAQPSVGRLKSEGKFDISYTVLQLRGASKPGLATRMLHLAPEHTFSNLHLRLRNLLESGVPVLDALIPVV
jgi:hypothetical protein